MANYGQAPYEESGAKSALRAVLAGLAAGSKVPRGVGGLQSFGLGLSSGLEQQSAAQQAAQNYAMKQMQAQQAEEDRTIRNRYIEAQMKALERPAKEEKKTPTLADKITEKETALGRRLTPKELLMTTDLYEKPQTTQEPLVVIQNPDGSMVYAPRSQASGKLAGGKANAPTAADKAKAGVLRAAGAAETNIRTQEDALGKMNLFDQIKLTKSPNWMLTKDPTAQKYRQAADWWIENVLREASGAAIATSEYAKYREIYFAQPGDSEEVKNQKRSSRQVILEKYRALAGDAAKDVPTVSASSFDPEGARAKYGY